MTSAQLQTIEGIFRAASELDPAEVAAFLKKACKGDKALHCKLEALLASRETAANFLEISATGLATRVIQRRQAESVVGQVIGHYKISHPIGSGGMGEVYLATDIRAGRKAALKLLPNRFAADPDRLRRFQQEAQAVTALNHPNILTVYEVGQDDSTYYIASELIEGETLRQRLLPKRIELGEAVEIAIQVASALAAAHDADIIHRDIKPENLMVRPDGFVKVLDFGIAKLASQKLTASASIDEVFSPSATSHGLVPGTVRYMSPEQARGAQVDKSTDIWSLGAVLYEMITGQAPFSGNGTEEVIAAILEREPPPLANDVSNAPAELQQIVSKALCKQPSQRYSSAHDLLHALKSFRRQMEVSAELDRRGSSGRSWVRGWRAALATGILATLLVLFFYSLRRPASNSAADKSIAVLPLENLSEDKENAFFADGVQDELLSNLAKIKDLKVISRTSVMQYKSGVSHNLRDIARQLGVSNVVEGSVRRFGNHVRVSVQLIDARTDRHLWGENYDRTLTDSVSLQGELATDIADAIGATLSPQERARLEATPTKNPTAYDAYLRARAIPVDWGFNVEGDIEGAIHLYERAVELDPNFTLAWAYLSIAQVQSVWKGLDPSAARVAAAKNALDRALALDPTLPEVHLALGYYRFNEGNKTSALAEFRQAEQGLPNSADVIEAIARMQRTLGHWDDAVADLRRSIELDPRDIRASNNLALTYCAMRRFPEALATLDRVLAWDPTNARALLTKADALVSIGDLQAAAPLIANPKLPANRRATYALLQRDYAAAVEILSKELAMQRDRRDPNDILALAFSQQLAGKLSAASATYQKAIENFRRELEKVAPGSFTEADAHGRLAAAYAGLGKANSAIAEGQRAMALAPSSEYPELGPNLEDEMARTYAQLGDAGHAISMLKRLLQTSYSGATFLTPATLRLDPIWDAIRNDPRFQQLSAEKVPLPEKRTAAVMTKP